MDQDYYKILGVDKQAGEAEIKKAYRKLAKENHPDLNPNNKAAEDKFKKVSEAYETLSDKEKRDSYDHGGYNPNHQGFGQGGSNARYQDIFNQNFSAGDFEDLFGRGGFRQRGPRKGEDQIYRLKVDFKDAVLGSEKVLTLENDKKISTKIPPGIKSGQKIKFKGRGHQGLRGGPPGDMYIEINVAPSLSFTRVGDDLETKVTVPFERALLGKSVRVETVDGAVELNLPKGVTSGSKIRIKGKGIRKEKSPGDLYAIVQISLPKEIDAELEEALVKYSARLEADKSTPE